MHKKIFLCYVLISTVWPIATYFRDYPQHADSPIAHFYYLNHTQQTLDFVLQKKQTFLGTTRLTMSVWDALEYLNTLVDDSDPDLQLPQIVHCLQTAEAMRRDNQPRWFILTGLIHDLGKILCLFGEPQWAVVGDTFPVGCAFSPTNIYFDFFKDNPDFQIPAYQTKYGIYTRHCGLDNVHMSWGHDEYLYHRVKNYLPEQAAYIIRFHSFYPQHQHNGYDHLLSDYDRIMFAWVKKFQKYDLYSKDQTNTIDVAALTPYYQELVREFFPDPIAW
jgi:inositol oxygenase